MRFLTFILIIFLSTVPSQVLSQTENFIITDSLKQKSFDDLEKSFFTSLKDSISSQAYALTIISKGKTEKDTIQILKGYSFLSYLNSSKKIYLSYADSIIKIAKNTNNSGYLSLGYSNKAEYYFNKRNYQKSLDNYLIAKKYISRGVRMDLIIDTNIGLLKSRLGQHNDALEIFKKFWNKSLKENYKETDPDNYLKSLFSLAYTYNRVKKYDSASYYNKLGLNESLNLKNKFEYYHFVLSEAVNDFDLQKYSISNDSIQEVLHNIHHLDKANQIVVYFYKGKVSLKLKKYEEAVQNFKRVDSLYNEIHDLIPEAREAYVYLIQHYKKNKDSKNQLYFIEQLLSVDSILNTNYRYLSKKINKEYDTPQLIEDKKLIIKGLENKNKSFSVGIYLVSLLFLISLFGLGYYFIRQKKLQKRFQKIISQKEEQKQNAKSIVKDSNKSIGISAEVIDTILEMLEKFEAKEEYLQKKTTINALSKKFNTNPNYLSKVINTYKKKSFSNYINELRINYVIKKLKTDTKFRKYTMKAIATEIGFNTTEAFSRSFHKQVGLYPSYFIKELEKQEGL
ncbi:AraC family transcriptional regulator [uncultured Aquimarina sp.]|uniref:AraC family transcriptional regulator n=1 Tax=uncultured Aquimarina sp. TaxID=575652 RepID=UPI002618D9AA|nr:AraC family transcriptional regulator [uncultured Aquimarina sp.]